MEENPRCQCFQPDGTLCIHKAQELHHRKGRHEYYLRVDTWMAVCSMCHTHIHEDGEWSKSMGYLLNRASSNPIPPLNE